MEPPSTPRTKVTPGEASSSPPPPDPAHSARAEVAASTLAPHAGTTSTPPSATLALVFGIAGMLGAVTGLLGFIGLGGIIFGHAAHDQIQASGGRFAGDRLATSGIVLGWLSVAIALVAVALIVLAAVTGNVGVLTS